jgi:SAM-dependent methyltransferase
MRNTHFDAEAWSPLAAALMAFHEGDRDAFLTVHTDGGEAETMSAAVFFREEAELRGPDREALALARGRVLDVGAGAGSLTLLLQDGGFSVTAVEIVPEAVRIMRERGVRDVRRCRLDEMEPSRSFDTILLLMNGTALAGSLRAFPDLLRTLEGLLAPGGQVLLDSTDLRPVPSESGPGESSMASDPQGTEGYPGELQYQLEFRGEKGAPFPQLFLDPHTLESMARPRGWRVRIVWTSGEGEYLARMTRTVDAEAGPV